MYMDGVEFYSTDICACMFVYVEQETKQGGILLEHDDVIERDQY